MEAMQCSPKGQSQPQQEQDSGLLLPEELTQGKTFYKGPYSDISHGKLGSANALVETYRSPRLLGLNHYIRSKLIVRYGNAQRVGQEHAVKALGFVCDSDNGCFRFVMQEMKYGPLLEVFKTDLKLSWDEKVQLTLDTCSALEYLHKNDPIMVLKYVHCRNVYVGENLRAKIADLSYIDTAPDRLSEIHFQSEVYGSPELVSGGSYTVKNDVFGAGIIALAIAKRKEPNIKEKAKVEDLPEDCPTAYEDVIKGLLAFYPQERMILTDAILILASTRYIY